MQHFCARLYISLNLLHTLLSHPVHLIVWQKLISDDIFFIGPSSSENSSSLSAPNKSTYGKWKRRKGQAPNRPIPQRRTIKCLPMSEIRRELEVIEIQQQGLEKQGVRLEQIIREKCEGSGINPDANAGR